MKIRIILFLSVFICVSYVSAQEPWNVEKSTHLLVYYKSADKSFVQEVIDRAEEYYNRIADSLGFRRYDFWLWDNRAKIYIYDDSKQYQQETGQPAWSSGAAQPQSKIIYTFPYAKGFFETVLPHEMGHIIFREFVGFQNPSVPTWLEEGVASYQESSKYALANVLVKESLKDNSFIGIERLNALRPHMLSDERQVRLFYSEAVSIVNYLIKEFGSDKFVLFCQELRDKKDFLRAMSYSYPFSDLEEFQTAWLKYVNK